MSIFTLRKDGYDAIDAIQRDGVTLLHLVAGTQVNADNAEAFIEEINALAREAAAFRWLANGLRNGEIMVDATGKYPHHIVIMLLVLDQACREVAGDTLLEAVEKAMAAESEGK